MRATQLQLRPAAESSAIRAIVACFSPGIALEQPTGSRRRRQHMVIKIMPNDKGSPAGQAGGRGAAFHRRRARGAEADWLRRVGAPQRAGTQRHISRRATYSVNGERRSFALLRPVGGHPGAGSRARPHPAGVRRISVAGRGRQLTRAAAPRAAAAVGPLTVTAAPAVSRAFSFARLGGSVHSARVLFSNSARKKRVLHAAVDDVPRQHRVGLIGRERCRSRRRRRLRATARRQWPPLRSARFDGRRDAAVAEREQRLVVRVPLALDVEVDVVDVRRPASAAASSCVR